MSFTPTKKLILNAGDAVKFHDEYGELQEIKDNLEKLERLKGSLRNPENKIKIVTNAYKESTKDSITKLNKQIEAYKAQQSKVEKGSEEYIELEKQIETAEVSIQAEETNLEVVLANIHNLIDTDEFKQGVASGLGETSTGLVGALLGTEGADVEESFNIKIKNLQSRYMDLIVTLAKFILASIGEEVPEGEILSITDCLQIVETCHSLPENNPFAFFTPTENKKKPKS